MDAMSHCRRGTTFLVALVLAVAIVGTPVDSAETRVPSSRDEIRLSFAPLVKRVAPAVVNIYTRRVVRSRPISPLFNDPLFRRFFGDRFSFGRPRARVQNTLGSGVLVRPDGLVVTNHHVIERADEITVVLADRREFDATIVSTDERTDLAILRIDPGGEPLPSLEMRDSDELEVGDLVLAIGNPFGVGQTVTSGIVSALARTAEGVSDFSFFIQTDAAINPGNSGGALISMDGRLVGVNTAIYSRTGGSVGIGFAIPSNMVATVVEAAENGSKVVRPWVGATFQDMSSDLAESFGLRRPTGVIVTEVYPGGPADRAGLRAGDVVLAVGRREVDDRTAFLFRIATLRLGASARLRVLRDKNERSLNLALVKAPEDPPRNTRVLTGRHPFSGAEVSNLSPALAEELSVDSMQRGVIVVRMKRGSRAHRLGIQPRDIILSVNDHEISRIEDLERAIARAGDQWKITFKRGGRTLTSIITG